MVSSAAQKIPRNAFESARGTARGTESLVKMWFKASGETRGYPSYRGLVPVLLYREHLRVIILAAGQRA